MDRHPSSTRLGTCSFHWYRGFAAANEQLFPRTWHKFQELANEYELVCARDGDYYVGFCYYTQDQDSCSSYSPVRGTSSRN